MSISSKVLLGNTSAWIEITINCDPVQLSDDDWEFVKLLVDTLRDYQKRRENARKDLGVTR